MNDFPDEHRYAWRLIRAARTAQAESTGSRDAVVALLQAALDAGLDRTELILELAAVGGRLLALCSPEVETAMPSDQVCLTQA